MTDPSTVIASGHHARSQRHTAYRAAACRRRFEVACGGVVGRRKGYSPQRWPFDPHGSLLASSPWSRPRPVRCCRLKGQRAGAAAGSNEASKAAWCEPVPSAASAAAARALHAPPPAGAFCGQPRPCGQRWPFDPHGSLLASSPWSRPRPVRCCRQTGHNKGCTGRNCMGFAVPTGHQHPATWCLPPQWAAAQHGSGGRKRLTAAPAASPCI